MKNYFELLLLVIIFIFIILYLTTIWREKRVKRQRDEARMVIDYLFDGLIMTNRSGQILKVNPKAEEMFGIKENEVIGKTFFQKPKSPYFTNFYRVISVMLEKGKQEWKELSIEKPKELVLRVTPIPVFDKKGKPSGFIYVLHDVTREKEIDKIKSEFITIVAHKLRTPLSEIKWAIDVLTSEKEGLSAAQREILEKCRGTNERIISQINSLLNVSEIEKGLFKYKFKFELFEDIVAEVVQNMNQFARDREISLKYQEPVSPLPEVRIDKEKISLAIHNLIDNAIRYTPKGGKVTLRLDRKGEYLIFSIRDTGIGISQTERERIFTKFFRGKKAMKIYTEGTGLSLFVVKNIIEKHSGRIWFESKEAEGSTFYFKLPI